MVKSVACYGYRVWLLKREEQRKLLALEMDFLRRSATDTKKSQTPQIRAKCKQNNQFYTIQRTQLKWYEQFVTMEYSRYPKKIYYWT